MVRWIREWGSCRVPTGSKGCSRCRVGGKAAVVGELQRSHGEGLSVGTNVFPENHPAPPEGEQLHCGKAPAIDEIHLEMLKALGVEGLSWLTHLLNFAWESGTMPKEWQTRGGGSPVKKGGPESMCQLQGYHTTQPPW